MKRKKEEFFPVLHIFLNSSHFLLVIATVNPYYNLMHGYFSENRFCIHTVIYSRCLTWREVCYLRFFPGFVTFICHSVNEVAFQFPLLQTANNNSKYEAILCVKLIKILRWFSVILLWLCMNAFWQCRTGQYF